MFKSAQQAVNSDEEPTQRRLMAIANLISYASHSFLTLSATGHVFLVDWLKQ